LPNFKRADLNGKWPYPDGHFDVIVSTEVIEHVENPWHFMREVKRLMKDDGIALITTPNNESERARRAFTRHGEFPWFRYEHLYSPLRHITPVFSWQMKFICHELRLVLRMHTWTPQDDMVEDNWIFEIKKP
jgi:SAM-dependent methyltransferase